ncbi:MAG TPA: hypothetical protein VEA44_13010 [Caulobacter sp.]|nr:hypothetical protein [Caulobacter sp.]
MAQYTLDDWQFVWPDVAAMARWRVRIQSVCPICRTQLWVPLRTIALTRGRDFSLWGLELPCNRVSCDGWRTFRAWVPEAGIYVDLVKRGHRHQAVVTNYVRYVEPPKPKPRR